jgi:predicted esterase
MTAPRMPWQMVVSLGLVLGFTGCSQRRTSASQPAKTVQPAGEHSAPALSVSATSRPAPLATSATPEVRTETWPPPPPAVQTHFCIEGIDALDESSCYILPDEPSDELLIYLHGTLPPTKVSPQKTNFQSVVKAASRRAGVAALLPRGRAGLAPASQRGWWGWPTSKASYQALAHELVAEIQDKRRQLERLTARKFQHVYLAGSSSGAYFVTALALHQALPADGYGIISGAADRADVELTNLPRTPIYIGFGTRDTVGDAARSLGARLERAGFPVKVAAHPLPHGTAEIYLDEAFAHFRGSRTPRGDAAR